MTPSPGRLHATRLALPVALWAAILVVPSLLRAQSGEEASVWQFGVRDVAWEAVERLQEDVRGYREAGAIGAYELRIRTHGARFDARVEAEIVDAVRLAELRGLDLPGSLSGETAARDGPRPSPS